MDSSEAKIHQLDLEAIDLEDTDPSAALTIWRAAKAMAERAVNDKPSSSSYYDLGYIRYQIWARTGEGPWESEASFLQSLSIEPNACLPLFYLGCLYFETNKYLEARSIFECIRDKCRADFQKRKQTWRYTKSLEMLLTTQIGLADFKETFDRLSEELEISYREEEEREYMIPLTITSALERTLSNKQDRIPKQDIYLSVARIVELTKSVESIRKRFPRFAKEFLPV